MKTSKNYKKLFADFWGYHEYDIPICWGCYRQQAVDIHHLIPKGMGGVKNNRLNRIDNLFPVVLAITKHIQTKLLMRIGKKSLKKK